VGDYVRHLSQEEEDGVVGLLYATLWESVASSEELEQHFGPVVAQQVWMLTEPKGGDSRRYWARHINRLSPSQMLVKLVSVLDILTAMQQDGEGRLSKTTTLATETYAEQWHHVFFVSLDRKQHQRLDARHFELLEKLRVKLEPHVQQKKREQEALEETAQYLLRLEQAGQLC
jgi:hypothetical protein